MKNKHKILMFKTICRMLLYIYAAICLDEQKIEQVDRDIAYTISALENHYGES